MNKQIRNVNFGSGKGFLTGSSGVGFTLINEFGLINQSRTTSGIYELVSGSGMYASFISFPDNFHGSIVWDTGELTPTYATEQYNIEENDPNLLTDLQFLIDMESGRWKLDATTKRMMFYKSDNMTLVAQFDLLDINGNPTIDLVTERRRV